MFGSRHHERLGHHDNDGDVTGRQSWSRMRPVMEPVVRMIVPSLPRPRPKDLSISSINYDDMKFESKRLQTFSKSPAWPLSFISPKDLARAGLFFLHREDKVECAFCRNVIGEWEQGDDPLREHKKHYPRCPFVLNLPVGNVPLSPTGETDPSAGLGNSPTTLSSKTLGIQKCSGPVHIAMITIGSRLKTFKDMKWPSSTGQSPETMSEAGFFYVGSHDNVKCFYCGGGLRNWAAGDNPMQMHEKWFPQCAFVTLNKSQDVTGSSPTLSKTFDSPSAPSSSSTFKYPADTDNKMSPKQSPKTGIALKDELKRLQKERQCKFCKTKEVCVVFLPCGHLAACEDCGKTAEICKVCDKPVKFPLRTYS